MERHVVLYDEECGFCRWSLDRLLRWDSRSRLRAVPIRSHEGDQLLADLIEEHRVASWHLVTPDGRRYSGGSATAPLARLLPAGAPVALLAETFPRAADRTYRWLARHRGALSEWLGERACAVDPSARNGRPTSG